jgi:hypothetical protein
MQPLNPFLAAFFKSSVVAQCTPVHHHILLVPLTDVLLTSRETDSGTPASEVIASEEFLGSHVLRIPSQGVSTGGKDGAVHNLRDVKGKAKQFSTLNGRSVVIKDSIIYSNKGADARNPSAFNKFDPGNANMMTDRLQIVCPGANTQ